MLRLIGVAVGAEHLTTGLAIADPDPEPKPLVPGVGADPEADRHRLSIIVVDAATSLFADGQVTVAASTGEEATSGTLDGLAEFAVPDGCYTITVDPVGEGYQFDSGPTNLVKVDGEDYDALVELDPEHEGGE